VTDHLDQGDGGYLNRLEVVWAIQLVSREGRLVISLTRPSKVTDPQGLSLLLGHIGREHR